MNIEVVGILLDAGYTNVFAVDVPDNISNYILVSDSGGFGVTTEDAGFTRPTIQVLVANKSYVDLNNTTREIRKYLWNITDVNIRDIFARLFTWDDWTQWTDYEQWNTYIRKDDGTIYVDEIQGFDISSDIIDLGMDEQRRYRKSINFTVFANID